MQLLASFMMDKFLAAEYYGNLLVHVRFEGFTVVKIKITDFKAVIQCIFVYRQPSTKVHGVDITFQKTASTYL